MIRGLVWPAVLSQVYRLILRVQAAPFDTSLRDHPSTGSGRGSGCLGLVVATRGSAATLYGAVRTTSYRVSEPEEVWIQSTILTYSIPPPCAIHSNRDAHGS